MQLHWALSTSHLFPKELYAFQGIKCLKCHSWWLPWDEGVHPHLLSTISHETFMPSAKQHWEMENFLEVMIPLLLLYMLYCSCLISFLNAMYILCWVKPIVSCKCGYQSRPRTTALFWRGHTVLELQLLVNSCSIYLKCLELRWKEWAVWDIFRKWYRYCCSLPESILHHLLCQRRLDFVQVTSLPSKLQGKLVPDPLPVIDLGMGM